MFNYLCMYIHIYVHMYMCTYTYIYMYSCLYVCFHLYICMCRFQSDQQQKCSEPSSRKHGCCMFRILSIAPQKSETLVAGKALFVVYTLHNVYVHIHSCIEDPQSSLLCCTYIHVQMRTYMLALSFYKQTTGISSYKHIHAKHMIHPHTQ